jgi:hypothetical protein
VNNVWTGYDSFKFDVFNPNPRDLIFNVMVRPHYNDNYSGIFMFSVAARPGYSAVEVDLNNAMTNNAGTVNWKKPVYQWCFVYGSGGSNPKDVFYVNNFRLEKEAVTP